MVQNLSFHISDKVFLNKIMSKNTLQSNNKTHLNYPEIYLTWFLSLQLRQNCILSFCLVPMFWGVFDYLRPIWGIEQYTSLQY